MKGYLFVTKEGWFVVYDQRTFQDPSAEDGILPVHPESIADTSFNFYHGKEVEFEINMYDGKSHISNAWNGYAKLVDSYPVSEETKPHSFCETPEEKCTMSYCNENGCINRKRNLIGEPTCQTETLYTEEQVIDFLQLRLMFFGIATTDSENENWLKQFKK